MSPRTKITREQWITAMIGLLAAGRNPADMALSELCEHLGVTKGSFYAHFSGGLDELHQEVIARWLQDNPVVPLTSTLTAVRDPADRLRLLWAQLAETARPDGAMRRWAARDGHAATAVATVDRHVMESVTAALSDMGFLPGQADVLGMFLTSAFAGAYHSVPDPPRADLDAFETLLEIIGRAAPVRAVPGGAQEVLMTAGSAPDQVIFFMVPKGLSAAAKKELTAHAQQLVQQAAGSDEQRPGRRRKRAAGTGRQSGA
jgi:AcrR family transcriptional regulator